MINSKNLFSLSINRTKAISSTIKPSISSRMINESSKEALHRLGPSAIGDYFSSLKNKEVIGKEIKNAMQLVGLLDKDAVKVAVQELTNPTNGVLLYLENLDEAYQYLSYIPESYAKTISECLENIELVDRINKNHKKISTNESYNHITHNLNMKNYKNAISELACIIDEYKLEPYKSMSIMIEEMSYIVASNNIKYDNSSMIYDILEYYLTNTNEDKELLAKTITSSKLLSETDTISILYFTDKKALKESYPSIKYVREWSNLNHSDSDYEERLYNVISMNIEESGDGDIKRNLPKLVKYLSETKGINSTKAITSVYTALQARELSKDELIDIKSSIEDLMPKNESIDLLIDKLNEDINSMYRSDNICVMEYLSDNSDSMPLNEFKKLKWKAGLLKAAFNLDKFLANKEKIWLKKNKSKLKRFTDTAKTILFGEDAELESYIGIDRKADIVVAQYYAPDIDNTVYEFADGIIKEFNNSQYDKNVASYYTITEGLLEFHVKDKTVLEMTDEEFEASMGYYSPVIESYLEMFNENEAYIKALSESGNIVDPMELFSRVDECTNFTAEHYNMAMEVMQYLNPTKEDIASIYESCKKYGLLVSESTAPEIEYVPIEIALEANQILQDIFENAGLVLEKEDTKDKDEEDEDDDWDDDEEDEDESEDKKDNKEDKKSDKEDKKDESPAKKMEGKYQVPEGDASKKTSFSYIKSLNSLKLAIAGLHANFKKLTGKGREIVEKLDHATRAYAEAIKKSKADINRERIISGSVIPAFKDIFKLSLMLLPLGGAAFLATKSVLYPAIIVLGGLALNNRSLKKEKVKILDEIETELEVIEKELALADQNNQLNKYRELLKIKKELQRQYQRIRYNIKTSNKLYSSGIAVPNKEA